MSTPFTPGPWRKFGLPVGRGSFSIWGPLGTGCVASATKGRSTGTRYSRPMLVEEGAANASLIAAAPDLYAVLARILDSATDGRTIPEWLSEELQFVHAALAKAVQP